MQSCVRSRTFHSLLAIQWRNKKTLPIINVSTNHKYVKRNAEWTVEAGIRLFGSEVKSFRAKLCDISAAYVTSSYDNIDGVEECRVNMQGCVIPTWRNLYHDMRRSITLLVTKKEAKRLSEYEMDRVHQIIPIKIFFNDHGLAKVTVAVFEKKDLPDKRKQIDAKEYARENKVVF